MSEEINRRRGVTPIATPHSPLLLDSGERLDCANLAWETYGTFDGDNAILVCHALTGSAHAAGVDAGGVSGWWHGLIGSGRGIDTDRWFVISANVPGGCYGSTGAANHPGFPHLTIRDMVRAEARLLDEIGVEHLHAVVGGSMGGMRVLEWGLTFPNRVDLLVPVATAARHTAWRLALAAIVRDALDLGAQCGDVEAGLRLARKLGTMTYRSPVEFETRFGRERSQETGDYLVESYLEHHAELLAARFDAVTYRCLVDAMSAHDITAGRGELHNVLASIAQTTLAIGISSDILYPAAEMREMASAIPSAIYREIESIHGHDAFLIEYEQLNSIIGEFLSIHPTQRLHEDLKDCTLRLRRSGERCVAHTS